MKTIRSLLLLLPFIFSNPGSADAHYAERAEVRDFIADMVERHGFDSGELTGLFNQASSLPAVIKAILPPADPAVRSWQTYRSRFVETKRINAGINFWQLHGEDISAASTRYGVPEEIIVAIIGVETIYGRHIGRFETFSALATLAFDYPPRAELFRGELEQLLLLAREQGRNPLDYRSSYAGAIGLPQFLPSSVRRYAVDFDGNGRIDLSSSPADAIGSVANFLQQHGWETGQPIVAPVQADGERCAVLTASGLEPQLKPSEMTECLLQSSLHTAAIPDLPAALIELVTPGEPSQYRVGYRNFYVLTRYNRSSFYAMAVNDLAEALVTASRSPPPAAARVHSKASRSRPSR